MLGTCIENVRKNVPLVHNITNYVTVNDVAIEKWLQLPAQADKTAWQTAETEISLQNGINYIIIQNSTSKGGCFELDYIKIRKKS